MSSGASFPSPILVSYAGCLSQRLLSSALLVGSVHGTDAMSNGNAGKDQVSPGCSGFGA